MSGFTVIGAVVSAVLLVVSVQLSNAEIRASGPPLEDVKQWNILTYNFPWNAPADDKDFYNPELVVATGIAVDHERIFVATPRLFSGVPATISTVPRKTAGDSPILQAYPDWSFHAAGRRAYNCSDLGLVSVYRMRIDSCNRLWALDAGVSRSLEDYEITCPPKILVFDLNTDQVVRRIDFPREVLRGESLFTNMVIDATTSSPTSNCDDVFIYITDTVEPALVVYDSGRDLTWRLTHPAMYPDPNFAQSNILGQRFTLMDGIVGLAFDANAGVVYFQPLATDRLFSIKTSALRSGPLPFGAELPIRLVGKKSSQGIGLEVSRHDGSIFFSPNSETAIAEWNPKTNKQNVLSYDPERLQFIADLRAPAQDPGTLYILSSRFHRFFLKNLDTRDINTRILRISGATNGIPPSSSLHPSLPASLSAYSASPYTFGSPFNFAPSPSTPIIYKTESPLGNSLKSSLVDNFFNSIRQPYQYEPVGIINRANKNPFTALNTGERPEVFIKPRPQFSSFSSQPQHGSYHTQQQIVEPTHFGLPSYLSKVNPNFSDFNGLRRSKSVGFNSTVVYH